MSEDRWSAVYYETPDGEEVVENEMKDFGAKSFTRILRTVELLEEFGIGLDEDYVEQVEGKIWELRISRYRVLYFAFHGKQFVLLRAFMKRQEKLPEKKSKSLKREWMTMLADIDN